MHFKLIFRARRKKGRLVSHHGKQMLVSWQSTWKMPQGEKQSERFRSCHPCRWLAGCHVNPPTSSFDENPIKLSLATLLWAFVHAFDIFDVHNLLFRWLPSVFHLHRPYCMERRAVVERKLITFFASDRSQVHSRWSWKVREKWRPFGPQAIPAWSLRCLNFHLERQKVLTPRKWNWSLAGDSSVVWGCYLWNGPFPQHIWNSLWLGMERGLVPDPMAAL